MMRYRPNLRPGSIPFRRAVARFATVVALLVALVAATSARADRLILRNLTILNDVTVDSFDLDGVRLADGKTYGWDEVERGHIAADRQAEFDRILGEVGVPLLRIRQNLESGADTRLGQVVDPVLPLYRDRRSPTAYLVNQAAMWGRLAEGRREEAVAAYIRALALLAGNPALADGLPGKRRMDLDPATGLVGEISPIFFDEAAAKAAYADVVALIRERNLRLPGVYLYAAALAVAGGDADVAQNVIATLQGDAKEVAAMRDVLALELSLARKMPDPAAARSDLARWSSLPVALRPAWLYAAGASMTGSDDSTVRDEGIVALLHVPALFAASEPVVSAAALSAAAAALERGGDGAGSARLRSEIASKYPNTSFAREADSARATP